MFSKNKKLSNLELGELRQLIRLIRTEEFKLKLVKDNTALVPGHKEWTPTQEGVVKVLENAREEFINECCARRGVKGKVQIDLETGKIYGSENSQNNS